jgi:hypothetical protein
VTACAVIAPPSPHDPLQDRATLDELIVGLWEAIGSHESVACPVCEGKMRPEYGAHARAIGGRCTTCGSTLH